MAFSYQEFSTTPAGVVAAVKAAILTSSNWSNPTGQVVQCTAQNGANMALDLVGGGAADNQRLRTMAYRLFSGGTGTNGIQRSLYWNRLAGNAAEPLRCRVAAGNTLLYIEIEGARPGELGTDNATYGSFRQCLFLAQITPYFGTDVVASIAFGGSASYQGYESQAAVVPGSNTTYVSRNQADTAPWVSARLHTLTFPQHSIQAIGYQQRNLASDGNLYVFPYVVFEDAMGIRGRLTDLFYCGWVNSGDPNVTTNVSDGMNLSYGGNTYKVTVPYKSDAGNQYSWGSLGTTQNQAGGVQDRSPMIAIRTV